jgi:hypothetical protein
MGNTARRVVHEIKARTSAFVTYCIGPCALYVGAANALFPCLVPASRAAETPASEQNDNWEFSFDVAQALKKRHEVAPSGIAAG